MKESFSQYSLSSLKAELPSVMSLNRQSLISDFVNREGWLFLNLVKNETLTGQIGLSTILVGWFPSNALIYLFYTFFVNFATKALPWSSIPSSGGWAVIFVVAGVELSEGHNHGL